MNYISIKNVRRLALAMLCFVPSLASSVMAFDIVSNGQAVTAIVIPLHETPVEQLASKEMQYHIQQSTGAVVPIIRDTQVSSGATGYIYLGATQASQLAGIDTTNLAPNTFVNKIIGGNLYVTGKDGSGAAILDSTHAGTLFGVYDFLETQMDVKWLWPGAGGEVIPTRNDVSVSSLDRSEAPALIHTRFRPANFFYQPASESAGWTTSEIKNSYHNAEDLWLRRQGFAREVNLDATHSFSQNDYWERFGTTNPEFFNLLPDGTRRPDPLYFNGNIDLVSMNVSNPDLHDQIVQDWLAKRTELEPYLAASDNDTPSRDLSPESLAWDVRDPNLTQSQWDNRVALATAAYNNSESDWTKHLGQQLSDRYAQYYLAVLEKAKVHDPDVKVVALAYQNYTKAPLETELNEDVVIAYTSQLAYPWTDEQRQATRDDMAGWASAGASMLLRPNYTLDGHAMPIYYADKFSDDFTQMYSTGMIGTDFNVLTGQWGTQGPTLYVIARKQTNPTMSSEDILDEYYGAFGNAAGEVESYFNHWEQVSDAVPGNVWETSEALAKDSVEPGHWSEFYKAADVVFTPQAMREGWQLLADATQAAIGDLATEQRVAFLEKGLTNADLTLAVQRGLREFQTTGNNSLYAAAINALSVYRASVEEDYVANMNYVAWSEERGWDYSLVNGDTESFLPTQMTRSGGEGLNASRPKIGQSFVPFLPAITGVTVNLTGGDTGDDPNALVRLDIFEVGGEPDGHAPIGESLGFVTRLLSDLDADDSIFDSFVFDSPVIVSPGMRYFFQLTLVDSAGLAALLFGQQATLDSYLLGTNLVFENNQWLYQDGRINRDLQFDVMQSTLYQAYASIPEPASIAMLLFGSSAIFGRKRTA